MSGLQGLHALTLVLVAITATVDAAPQAGLPIPPNALTHSGNEFLVAFLENDEDPSRQAALFVTTDEPTPVNFTIEIDQAYGASMSNGIASYGRTTQVLFSTGSPAPSGADIRVRTHQTGINTDQSNKNIRVKAEDGKNIIVFGLTSQSVSTDAFLALPCQAYNAITGRALYEYFIFSSTQRRAPNEGSNPPDLRSAFLIVTCQDDTQITVTSPALAFLRGSQSAVRIDPGMEVSHTETTRRTTILVQGGNREVELTGAIVTSNKPISVFSGHQCGRIPIDRTACDHLMEQIPPHVVWGTTFFAVPLATRRSGDIFRVGAIRDNTVINVTCVTPGSSTPKDTVSATRNRSPTPQGNNYYEFDTGPPSRDSNFQADYCCIETDKPVAVMQYSKGHSIDELPNSLGDPFLMLVPPVQQSFNNFTLSTLGLSTDYESSTSIAISAEFFSNSAADQAKVRLNNETVTASSGSWTPIYCRNRLICGYGAQTGLATGGSTLVFNDPLGGMNVYSYGFKREASYGYPGGFRMEPIAIPSVTLRPENITVRESAGMVTVQVLRSGDIGSRSIVYFNTRSTTTGGATAGECSSAGSDYVPPPQGTPDSLPNARRKRFRPDQDILMSRDGHIQIMICNDTVEEESETFEVYLTNEYIENANLIPIRVATVTIVDDDGEFTVQFDPASYTVDETDGVASITIVSNKRSPSANDGAALFYTESGTATAGTDFTGITSANAVPVIFPVGSNRTTVTVPIISDTMAEEMEQFLGRLQRSSSAPANFRIPVDTATVVIIEAATAVTVEFDPTSYTVSESDRYANITIVKRERTSQTVSVTFSTMDGSATAGEDYTATSETVTFLPTEMSKIVMVPITNDNIFEGLEQFTAQLSIPAGETGVMLGAAMATVDITDDDSVTVEFDPTSYTVSESDRYANITVVKRGQTTQTVSVNFTTADGSATAGQDYSTTSQIVTFAPTQTSQVVMVPIIDDSVGEGSEQFTARLSVPAGQSGVVLGASMATVEITDDDPVTVEFDPISYTVSESDRYANITIVKRGQTTQTVTVDFNTADGSATAGDDYTTTSRSVTFAPSETSQIVMVPIIEDQRVELDETFIGQLTLPSGSSGVVLGTATTATVTITDADNVVVQFDPTGYMVAEGGSTRLRVVKVGVADVPVSVSLSTVVGTAGLADFTPITNQVVTFQPGETMQYVNFTSLSDNIVEGTEMLTAVLSNPSTRAMIGQQDTAMINITDDAAVTVQFDPIAYTVAEADDAVVRFRIVKLTPTTQTVSVRFSTSPGTATDPADFTGQSNVMVTFAPGETVQYVNVSVVNDGVVEGDEMFTATLTSTDSTVMIGSNNNATATIIDNDMVEIEFDPTSYTVNENNGTVILRVRKTGTNNIPVTVDIITSGDTAGDPGDFTGISRTLTFPPGGDAVLEVPVSIINDTIAEGTEEFFATLDDVDPNVNVGDDDTASITILDNDAVEIEFDPTSYTVNEDNGTVILFVRKTGTKDVPVTVDIITSGDTAGDPGDFIGISRTLTFPPGGDAVLEVPVSIINDTIAEGTEEFFATLDDVDPNVNVGDDDTASITILDNDDVTVVPDVPNVEVPEGNGTVTVCFNTTTGIATPLSLQVTAVEKTTGNIATAGADFTPATRTITFPPSPTPTRACTSFDITNDTIGLEGNEMFTVRVGQSGPESWVTIIDDDVVEVEFVEPMYTVPESNNATVCLRSNIGSMRDVEVTVTVSEKMPVDAQDGMDFNSGTPRAVTFPAGNSGSTRCIQVHIINDEIEEQPESFNVDFSFVNDTGVRKGPNAQTMVTIMDNDMLAVNFEMPNVTVPEDNGTVTICLNVNRGISTPLPVVLIAEEKPRAGGNAATAGEDFMAETRTVTFPPSPTPGRVCTSFNILDDQIGLEGNEMFTVRVNFTGEESCVTIMDNDVVEVEFVEDMYTVPESNGSVTVCLRSDIETKRDLVIMVTASNKSPAEAEDGIDYNSGPPRSLTFPAGVAGSTRCTQFDIIDDTIQENNEGFNVDFEFVDGMGARKGTVAQSMVIITDDDVARVVPDVPNVEVPEGNGTVTVCFNTTTGIATPLILQVTAVEKTTGNIATAGADFTPATRTITFPPSPTPSQMCTSFDITNDTIGLEGNEMFTVRVGQSGPESWVTIIDDDVVEVEFVEPVYTAPEGAGPATVCLRSNIGTKTDFNITVTASEKSPVEAQDGMDYNSGPPRTLTFPAGVAGSTRCTQFDIIDDTIQENNEGFNVDFEFVDGVGKRKGTVAQSMVIITDDDVVMVVPDVPNVEVPEGNGTVTVCFNTTTGIATPLILQVTAVEKTTGNIATAGDDFTPATRTITFPPSPTPSQMCTSFDITNDTIGLEGNEMFTVRVGQSGPESWVTIIDDDVVEVEFVEPVYTAPEGAGPATVCLRSNIGTKTDFNITVTASEKSPVEAQDGMDYNSGPPRTLTFPAGVAGSTRCTQFDIIDDTIQENNEGFNVDFEFVDGVGKRKGTVAQSMVIITDDDVVMVVPDVPNVEVPEGNGTVTVCFNTTTGIATPLIQQVTAVEKTTGNIATAGDDFTPATRTITFPPSPTPTRVCTSFDITNDTIGLEGNEMFTVRVGQSGPESWVTIIDDDVVEVEFVEPMYTVPEANNATVCLRSNIGSMRDVEVTVTVSEKMPVDARDGMDFNSGTPRAVTFPAGNSGSTRCIQVHIINDEIEEQPESFNVDFSFVNDTGVRKGPNAQTMVTIMDDEMLTVNFEMPNVTVPEDNGTVTICLNVNRGISTPLPVVLIAEEKPRAGGNAATAGEDFMAETRTVTFPPSPTPGRVCTSFNILDDQIGLEGNEMFTVRVNLTGEESCVTIMDNDVVEVEFVEDMYTVPESNGSVTVCLRSDIETKRDLVIMVTASNKSPAEAEDGMDYNSGPPRSLTFPAGVAGSTRCTQFDIIDDTIQENNEGFNVDFEFVDGMGARKGTVAQSMVIITDDDVARVVPDVPNVEVPEGNGTVTVCFNTTTGIATPLVLQVTAVEKTTGNIATAGDDFTPATRTITFPPSSTPSQMCTSFDITNDTIGLEGNEMFTVRVGQSGPESWVTIIDDDVVEVEFVEPVYTVPEANGSVTVCLRSNIRTKVDLNVTVLVSEKSPVDAQDGMDFRRGPPRLVTFPAGVVGSTRCIDIDIIDDNVALENDEGFNVDFEFMDDQVGLVRKGSIPQSMVIITDEDVVIIDFQTANVTVNENNGTVTVCLEKDKDTDEPIIVEVTEDEGTAVDGADFIAEPRNITFAPNARVACTSLPLVDDTNIEQPEAFRVNFNPRVPGTVAGRVMRGMRQVANVTIIDDDAVSNVTICSVTQPLIVSPFQSSMNYSFRGSCEHVIVSPCDGSPDFRITVDFLADTLQNGRIGASYNGRMYVSREDGTVTVDSNTEVISTSGNTIVYQGNVAVTRDSAANKTTIDFEDLGVTIVHQFGEDPSFQVNISDTSTLGETCGLCGTTDGVLQFRNGNTANIMNRTEVDAFANSYLVAPRDQFLHPQRRECGQVTNDTVIGDPLFTVPISPDGRSLCFEIHGQANTIFNLVSDVCTSINANYTAMNIPENGNIISQIGVLAKPNAGQCKNVRVELEGCRAFIGDTEVIGVRNEEGVVVRRMRNRVRISVPNCDNLNLVMWVMCQNNSGQPMIRFVITRGLNLRPTSHGLLGQFWNIPVNVTRFTGTVDRSGGNLDPDELYVVTVTPEDGYPPRSFLAEQFVRTWENRPGPCLYAGNAQGGWSGEVNSLNSPVIQGSYRDYIVNGLFETDFTYSRFEEQSC